LLQTFFASYPIGHSKTPFEILAIQYHCRVQLGAYCLFFMPRACGIYIADSCPKGWKRLFGASTWLPQYMVDRLASSIEEFDRMEIWNNCCDATVAWGRLSTSHPGKEAPV